MSRTPQPSQATLPLTQPVGLTGVLGPVAEAVGRAIAREVVRNQRTKPTKANSGPKRQATARCEQSAEDVAQELEVNLAAVTLKALTKSLSALSSEARMALIAQLAGGSAVNHTLALSDADNDPWLTTADAAARLEVSRPYVAMLCDAGKLGLIMKTEGGHRRIQASAVTAYIAERSRSNADAASPREAGIAAGLYAHDDERYVAVARRTTSKPAAGAVFRFRVSKVEKLPRAGVGVLEGTVLAGRVTTGQELTLVHGDQRLSMRLEGVVLETGNKPRRDGALSLSFKLKTPGFAVVEAGDELIAG